jgi:hypothetical protein
MAKYIVRLEGTADMNSDGITHSNFDAYLGFDPEKGTYFNTLTRNSALFFNSEEEAEAAFSAYVNGVYRLRFARYRIEVIPFRRKVLHLENKATGVHKYYGSLVAMCSDNKDLPYHTLKRIIFESPWENEVYKIRLGELLTPSDVKN